MVVRRVGLLALVGDLVGNGALILGVEVLVAILDTLLVAITLVDGGLWLDALVTGLVERTIAHAGLAGAVGGLVSGSLSAS